MSHDPAGQQADKCFICFLFQSLMQRKRKWRFSEDQMNKSYYLVLKGHAKLSPRHPSERVHAIFHSLQQVRSSRGGGLGASKVINIHKRPKKITLWCTSHLHRKWAACDLNGAGKDEINWWQNTCFVLTYYWNKIKLARKKKNWSLYLRFIELDCP